MAFSPGCIWDSTCSPVPYTRQWMCDERRVCCTHRQHASGREQCSVSNKGSTRLFLFMLSFPFSFGLSFFMCFFFAYFVASTTSLPAGRIMGRAG
jgi:hypothetical protein